MCFPILVAKYACQFGHVYDAVSCWSQCEEQSLVSCESGEIRLCKDAEFRLKESPFPMVKSHAKSRNVTPYSRQCFVCLQLETHPGSRWEDARDNWELYKKKMIDLERETQGLTDQVNRFARRGFLGFSDTSK